MKDGKLGLIILILIFASILMACWWWLSTTNDTEIGIVTDTTQSTNSNTSNPNEIENSSSPANDNSSEVNN